LYLMAMTTGCVLGDWRSIPGQGKFLTPGFVQITWRKKPDFIIEKHNIIKSEFPKFSKGCTGDCETQ